MATPKAALNSTSTPKNPHTTTPNRPVASPRPNIGAFGSKTLAYKSPAVKTPSSVHGHSHRVSISSHPTSTPLAAPAIHDELLNLNSPAAALIASIGNAGLTPMATGQDGLGINNGITSQPMRGAMVQPRNPEVERVERLEQVVKLLETKTTGYGVTRESIERIAQIQGFTILWDENNLTIAGTRVDLEITFDDVERDLIRDVQLRFVSESEEPQLQHDASQILKRHLMTMDGAELLEPWKNLKRFSHDLEYLSKLDYLDTSVNCFELMSDLYTAFRKIWDEESKRVQDENEINHVCQGNIGQPFMNSNDQLGMTVQYWVDRHGYLTVSNSTQALPHSRSMVWTAVLSCDKGNPGINAHRNWIENEVLRTTVTTEDVFQESMLDKPNWTDLSLSNMMDQQAKDADTLMLEGDRNTNTATIDLVFTCRLDATVLIPVNAAHNLNDQYPMIEIDRSGALTYQQALLNESQATSVQAQDTSLRWSKSCSSYSTTGEPVIRSHSYSLFTTGVPWSYPVTTMKFSHPKQLADAVPLLRQYALLWTILRSTLIDGAPDKTKRVDSRPSSSLHQDHKKPRTKRRSNKKAAEELLEDMLGQKNTDDNKSTRIDLTIDLLSDASKPRIEVIVPTPSETKGIQTNSFVRVNIEVRRNGVLEISSIDGVLSINEEKLKRKAAKVLSLSEDIAVLVDWLLGEMKNLS